VTQATIAPKNTARLNLRQISGPVVKIVPHVHEPAGGLCDAFRRHGISGGGATVSVCRPADRRAWPVPDSRGTSQRPTRRFRENESSDARGPRVLPSGDLLQSPAVGIEVWQAPPTHCESLVRRGLGGIARRTHASESSPRCGRGAFRSPERTRPAPAGPPRSSTRISAPLRIAQGSLASLFSSRTSAGVRLMRSAFDEERRARSGVP
jgi:hypothetical protein